MDSKPSKRNTPWGRADFETDIGEGIIRVDTPSHGGYFVPMKALNRIPEKMQNWAKEWSGSNQWYEEDCCWECVAYAFPNLFPVDAVKYAIEDLTKRNLACVETMPKTEVLHFNI